MVQGSGRARFTGSAFIRLLAQLTEADVPESRQAFAERLGQWLSWTDAISLSSALSARPPSEPVSRSGLRGDPLMAEERELARVRRALAKTIAEDTALAAAPEPVTPHTDTDDASIRSTPDYSRFRRVYIARQQAMEVAIAPARDRLRSSLAATSPSLARLAAVDAVMEQALAEHERDLLSAAPVWLERRYEHLRQAHHQASPPDDTENLAPRKGWLELFIKDMQALLLAELELRLQPLEGLLAALRMRHPRNE